MMAEAATDWIDWAGGECPVSPDTIVDVRFDIATEMCGYPASDWVEGAHDWWKHEADGSGCDIIAYRVVPTVAPTYDDQIGILRAALQDIAGAEATPNDAEAFAWCRDVARDALAKVTAA